MLLNINSKLRNIRNKFKSDKRGVTAVEYAIIAVAMSSIILFVFKDGTLKTTLMMQWVRSLRRWIVLIQPVAVVVKAVLPTVNKDKLTRYKFRERGNPLF